MMQPFRSAYSFLEDFESESPPRNWGDGFRLFHCSRVDMQYRYDEPGVVPEHEPNVEAPEWKLIIKTMKRCSFHYGPWADRQREYLWKFFFPPTYQRMEPSVMPTPGELRQHTSLVVEVHTVGDVDFEVLFRSDTETRVLHLAASPGSYFETRVPWVVGEDGYTTEVLGKLLNVEGSAGHICRNLLRCDILDFDIAVHYPQCWNQHQAWRLHFDTQDALVTIVFDHKNFFKDLVDDWMRKARPDLISFVPYTYDVSLNARRLHFITMANDFNWIASNNENAHISFFADDLELTLRLPYVDFLPETVPITLEIKGYSVVCRLSLPETSTSREVVLALSSHLRLADRRGEVVDGSYMFERHSEKLPDGSERVWVDVWVAPNVGLVLRYTYHPIPVVDSPCKRFLPSQLNGEAVKGCCGDAEVEALRTLRPEGRKHHSGVLPSNFDPSYLEPDLIEVELKVPSSTICLYGALLRHFVHVKENYFGSYQEPIGFGTKRKWRQSIEEAEDPRAYRSFAVKVNAQIHDVQGHLLKHCSPSSPPCPALFLDCLGFEMDKRYHETKLQVLLGPVVAKVQDNFRGRPDESRALSGGFLMMAGLQVRGHACFSHEGLPLDCETLEYAWNVDLTIGEIGGRLTGTQLTTVVQCLQMFVFLVKDSENELVCSQDYKICQHGYPQSECPKWTDEKDKALDIPCPTEDDIKYKFIRLSTDGVDVHIVEWGTSLQLCIDPLRLATCNLHGPNNREGITAIVPRVRLTQYMHYKMQSSGPQDDTPMAPMDSPGGESISSPWLEAGSMSFGPVSFSAGIALVLPEYRLLQDRFLRLHDDYSRRLWFLWSDGGPELPSRNFLRKCGCLGGCAFFGNNLSGRSLLADWGRKERWTEAEEEMEDGDDEDDEESTGEEPEEDEEEEMEFSLPEREEASKSRRAILHLVPPDVNDMGFGQSLLQAQSFVFELHDKDCCVESRTGMRMLRPEKSAEEKEMAARMSTRPMSDMIEDESISPGSGDDMSEGSGLYFNTQHVSFMLDSSVADKPTSSTEPKKAYRTISLTSLISSTSEASRTDESATADGSTPSDEGGRSWSGREQLVDLRTELENPISESPLLMNAYRRHLTQFSCRRWALPMHVRKFFAGQTIFPLPRFTAFADGFSPRLMVNRPQGIGRKMSPRQKMKGPVRQKSSPTKTASDNANSSSKESQFSSGDSSARTTATIRLQGSVDVLLTPLFLECMQRYVTTLTPELSHMHACTVMDNLHCQCVQTAQYKHSEDGENAYDDMKEQENPKKAQDSAPPVGSATPQTNKGAFPLSSTANLAGSAGVVVGKNPQSATSPTSFEPQMAGQNPSRQAAATELGGKTVSAVLQSTEAASSPLIPPHPGATTPIEKGIGGRGGKSSMSAQKYSIVSTEDQSGSGGRSSLERTQQRRTMRTQFTVSVERVNVCFVQLSTVEDIVTLESIINSVKDLTCVSLLAFSLDRASLEILINKETNHPCTTAETGDGTTRNLSNSGQTLYPPASQSAPNVEEGVGTDERNRPSESSEEMIACVSAKRIHLQLRRLTRMCNFTESVQLTAVPPRHSKVLFAFEADLPRTRMNSVSGPSGGSRRHHTAVGDDTVPLLPQRSIGAATDFQERSSGLIMFECGLEALQFRCLRRRGYTDFLEYYKPKKSDTLGHTSTLADEEKEDEDGEESESTEKKKRTNAFQSKLDVSRVWLHFASPDRLPNKRRIDISRYDWNLLSTSTPAIKAWMRPSERLLQTTRVLKHTAEQRLLSVMACVMTEALDNRHQVENRKKQTSTNKDFYFKHMTPAARSLRIDPSCQIFTALRRYLDDNGSYANSTVNAMMARGSRLHEVEALLRKDTLPDIVTLQRGILALTREWRHFVYVPQFAVAPRLMYQPNDPLTNISLALGGEQHFAAVQGYENRQVLSRPASRVWMETELSGMGSEQPILSPSGQKFASVDDFSPQPDTSAPGPASSAAAAGSGEENPLLQVFLAEVAAGPDASLPLQSQHVSYARLLSDTSLSGAEDLYQWVKSRQQAPGDTTGGKDNGSLRSGFPTAGMPVVEHVPKFHEAMHWEAQAAYVADAQVLFRPLLEAVGLHVGGIRRTTLMRKFGGYFSGQGMLDAFQVDIVRSEGNPLRRRRFGAHGFPTSPPQHAAEPCAAFLCQGFASRIVLRDVVDFVESGRAHGAGGEQAAALASTDLEIKPTTTHMNVGFHINLMRQRVNLSLLRLVHQFVTMVYSVQDQREELERKRRCNNQNFRRHRKQDSKGSSTGTESTGSTLKSYARLQSESSSGEEAGAAVTMPTPGSPASGIGQTPIAPTDNKDVTPRCWRRLNHLLELYSRPIETKTIRRKGASTMPPIAEEEPLPQVDEEQNLEAGTPTGGKHSKVQKFTHSWVYGERIPIVVFVTAKVKQVRISALLSGLNLEANVKSLHGSFSRLTKVKGRANFQKKSIQQSVSAHIGESFAKLTEGEAAAVQNVVQMTLSKSHLFISCLRKRTSERNAMVVGLGKVEVVLPHHPVRLHEMMQRSTQRLSHSLQEFMRATPSSAMPNRASESGRFAESYTSFKGGAFDGIDFGVSEPVVPVGAMNTPGPGIPGSAPVRGSREAAGERTLVVRLTALAQGLRVTAAILPSLNAVYEIQPVTFEGQIGPNGYMYMSMPDHMLSFRSMIALKDASFLPSVSIKLPRILLEITQRTSEGGSYWSREPWLGSRGHRSPTQPPGPQDKLTRDLVVQEGTYLDAYATLSLFEEKLTTDLLNYLVVVVKAFMKEVNEVIQKMSGEQNTSHVQPMPSRVPLISESSDTETETAYRQTEQEAKQASQTSATTSGAKTAPGERVPRKPTAGGSLMSRANRFTFRVAFAGIRLTATTPTNSSVKLETSEIQAELSNRVVAPVDPNVSQTSSSACADRKYFLKVNVNAISVELGHLDKDILYTERTPDFKTLAVFKTTIGLRNCLSEEMIATDDGSNDLDAFLIALTRPIVWMKPSAFDKAVVLWISYKNAFERWNDQMDRLVSQATTPSGISNPAGLSSIGGVQMRHRPGLVSVPSTTAVSTLFLQLTVDDLGICLPTGLIQVPSHTLEVESRTALVLTLESSRISACSKSSLVSKGEFTGFCLRFDDDFNLASDDWKPVGLGDPSVLASPVAQHSNLGSGGHDRGTSPSSIIMNACVVPKGSFEVCSRTIDGVGCNPKWVLDVKWLMRGLDVHLDVNIGRRLKVLFATVTSMAGYLPGDMDDLPPDSPVSSEHPGSGVGANPSAAAAGGGTGADALDPVVVEQKFAELDSLIQSGAETSSLHDLDQYQYRLQRLQELEARLCSDVKRNVWQRLRKRSARNSQLRDRLRLLHFRPPHSRSNSVADGSSASVLHSVRTPMSDDEGAAAEEEDDRPLSTSPRSYSVIEHNYTARRAPREEDELSLPSSPPSSGHVLEDEFERLSLRQRVWTGPTFIYPCSPPVPPRRRGRPTALPLSSSVPASRLGPSLRSASSHDQGRPGDDEPSVDLEFSARINVDTGKCVLHPRIEEEGKSYGSSRGMGGRYGGLNECDTFAAPSGIHGDQRSALLNRYRSYLSQPSAKYSKITTFFLPGVIVKMNYNSRTEKEQNTAQGAAPSAPPSRCPKSSYPTSVMSRRKKADLYASCSLQTLPKEMVVSPALLDFLEQALETLPFISVPRKTAKTSSSDVTEPFPLTPVESFPVDVIVHINVQPSTVRLTCLPLSPVQCLLKLPSLDLVFSTRRSAQSMAELPLTIQQEEMFTEGGLCVSGRLSSFSLYIFHPYGNAMRKHVGAGSRSSTSGSDDWDSLGRSDSLSLDVEFVRVNISRYRRAALLCAHGDQEDKEKAARTRLETEKGRGKENLQLFNTVQISAVCDIGSSKFNYDTRRTTELVILPKAWYRSNLARRLFLGEEPNIRPEDGTFRDGVVTAPASGASGASRSPSHASMDGVLSAPLHSRPASVIGHHRRSSSGDKHKIKERILRDLPACVQTHHRNLSACGLPRNISSSPDTTHMPGHRSLRRRRRLSGATAIPAITPGAVSPPPNTPNAATPEAVGPGAWETLVLICANVCDVQVEMYMGSAMGKTRLGLKGITGQGHLKLDSESRKGMTGGVHLNAGYLTAEEGIVGGEVALMNLNADLHVTENPEHVPEHAVSITLGALESRIEYMSANILYGRVSGFAVRLFDEWTLRQPPSDPEPGKSLSDEPVACRRRLQVSVDGQVEWDQLHFMICRSTTVDLVKAYRKVLKFLTDQLMEYERLGDHRRSQPSAQRQRSPPQDTAASELMNQLLQRHWQAPMQRLMACSLRIPQSSSRPRFGPATKGDEEDDDGEEVSPCDAVIMGGHLELNGGGLALACFAGTFRAAKSWAVFALRRPLIDFSTEAQLVRPMEEEGEEEGKKLHVEQVLIFQLGDYYGNRDAQSYRSGTISKLSRKQEKQVPPNIRIRQWFNYTFSCMDNSSLDQPMSQFPVIRRPSFGVSQFSGQEETPPSAVKDTKFVHEREDMFYLPPMQVTLQTFHLQGMAPEDLNTILLSPAEEKREDSIVDTTAKEEEGSATSEAEGTKKEEVKIETRVQRPEVQCVFVSEFADHVLISVNADIIVFLQNLVKSYLSEKIQEDSRTSFLEENASTGSPMVKDVRTYNCTKWQLNPTIRNMKAKELDYTLADVIVKKLGFSQRTTIPKWMQRGLMDNMDNLSAILVDKVIEIMEMESTGAT